MSAPLRQHPHGFVALAADIEPLLAALIRAGVDSIISGQPHRAATPSVATFEAGEESTGTFEHHAIGTSDRATARDRAADLTQEAADKGRAAANQLEHAINDGALTAKIKSKMALDDNVNARTINIDTTNAVVTLKGTVGSEAERERAVRLAKETRGVTRVEDLLQVQH